MYLGRHSSLGNEIFKRFRPARSRSIEVRAQDLDDRFFALQKAIVWVVSTSIQCTKGVQFSDCRR